MSHYDDSESAPFAPRHYHRESDGNILLAGNGRKEPMSYQYPQRDAYANPLLGTIEASEELLTTLDNAAQRLERALAAAAIAKAAERDAKETLAMHEAEHVVEWTGLAEVGEGPLVGVAKTSKAYQYALDNALAAARRNGLKQAAAVAYQASVTAMNAEIELQSAQTQFRACLAAADLRTAILNGRTKSAY
jgi:hypothetical protein